MATIPGASQFINAATLANTRGISVQQPTVLSASASSTSLLDAGRSIGGGNGIGLSASARAINQQFLNNSADINAMFSLGIGTSATVEGAQQNILALRAGLNDSQLARSLRADDGSVSISDTGELVDTEA